MSRKRDLSKLLKKGSIESNRSQKLREKLTQIPHFGEESKNLIENMEQCKQKRMHCARRDGKTYQIIPCENGSMVKLNGI